MSAHLTASVFPLDDLCLVNRNSVRLIRVGQSTHNLQAVVTQEDSSSLLSTWCWGKVNCLMGGSACSWPPFRFLDLFYLPQPRVGLWWSVTGEDIPEADPDCAWVPDSSKSHLSCSIFFISELLLGKTVQQPMDCLCNGSLLLTAVFSANYLVLDSGLLVDTLACWHTVASLTSPVVAEPAACPWWLCVLCANKASVVSGQRRCQVAQPSVPGAPGGFTRTLSPLRKAAERASLAFLLAMIFFFLNPFVCAGTTDCVMSWITLTVFLLDQSLIQCFLCIKWGRRDPEGQKRNCGKTCVCWYPSSSTVSQLLWDVKPVVQRCWSALA